MARGMQTHWFRGRALEGNVGLKAGGTAWGFWGAVVVLLSACGSAHPSQEQLALQPAAPPDSPDAGTAAESCATASDAVACAGPDCCAVPIAGRCGDGVLDALEECDDGNTRDGDGCSSNCLSEVCGNGRVDPGETCDQVDPSCSPTCQLVPGAPPGCGNGVLEEGEQCDDGNLLAGDGCDSMCRREECGNARLDAMETCDPPDGITCNERCQLARCGDGHVDAREQCDDGNGVSGDGCSAACIKEFCGDGIVNQAPGVEQCEPPGAGPCDATCHTIECGNGLVQGLEQCDDGNRANGDGCNENCRKEICGNGQLDPGEDCEPPLSTNCDATCHALRAECGNGIVEPGEECDDGNVRFGDGCSPSCFVEECGDGRVEGPAEECEPPGTAGCNANCRIPRCGDGIVDTDSGEECEDGNLDNGDGCSSTCQLEQCGNGRLEAPEQCEPPGTAACDAKCRARSNATQPVELPAGASLFQLRNSSFGGSLDAWQIAQSPAADVSFSPLDAEADDGSGSVELDVQGSAGSVDGATVLALVIGDPTLDGASLGQCIQTAPGATYGLSARAEVLAGAPGAVSVQLGARFYQGSDCAGRTLDGVSTEYVLEDTTDWQTLTLPPPGPVSLATFAAPSGAGSMLVWVQVPQDLEASSVLLDSIQLQRGTAPVCGDGIPEGSEECEPSVTRGCSAACKLPVVCGDGIAAPSECVAGAAAGACPQDCPKAAAVCGDGQVTPPEECDPPGAGTQGVCSKVCTIVHAVCGDGRVDAGEQCDPPNGESCDSACKTMRCGDGIVQSPEECEPPGSPGCSSHCRKIADYPATCGDGVLQGAEQCDPPNPKTWCSSTCQRRDPAAACGDGTLDQDLGEACDPPGYANNCSADCRRPVCGDGVVNGAEQCEPPDGLTCGKDCQFIPGSATDCQACLADTCSGPAPLADLFSACFGLPGVAQAGPAKGVPLRQLCADVVACLANTGCDAETESPNPVSCYCGKQVLVDSSSYGSVLSECRDAVTEATGACRTALERAAEGASPGTVLAAMDPKYGKPAVTAALGLMKNCGHPVPTAAAPGAPQRSCSSRCSPTVACGDGLVEIGEKCDPKDPEWGNQGTRWLTPKHPTCDGTYCTVFPCGNGTVDKVWPADDALRPAAWKPETCDVADPYTSAQGQCDNDCQLITVCGDGKLTASKEACDPGGKLPWTDCCHPGDTDAAGLLGCDTNGNGRVDDDEGCQRPAVCGNGVREGAEECDEAPELGHCSDKCKLIRTSPCDICSQANCARQLGDCFNGNPSTTAGCIAVHGCYASDPCMASDLLSCLCGNLPADVCVSSQDAPGPCHQVIQDNIGSVCPGIPSTSCMVSGILSTASPAGVAGQLAQCQQNFCFAECFTPSP